MNTCTSVWSRYANTPCQNKGLQYNELIAELRSLVQESLPHYMVPSLFIPLESMPLTANGKIDRKALPVPKIEELTSGRQPITPTEELLAGLWSALLHVESVSRDDNFFAIGGHSLSAIQLVARIRDIFNIELPVRSVFTHPELSSLAAVLDGENQTAASLPPITAQPEKARKQLSFAQQRLWFLDQFEEDAVHYNMPGAWLLTGKLNISALEQSLHWLLERHHVLRSSFPSVNGEGSAEVHEIKNDILLQEHDLRHFQGDALQSAIKTEIDQFSMISFDLQRSFPIQFKLLHLHLDQAAFMLNTHHIASDGWSVDVLLRELQLAYNAFAENHQPDIPELAIQYSDFAAWQRQWLQGEVLQRQMEYWRRQLADIPELLELPTDKTRPARTSYQGGRYASSLPSALSQAVIALSRQEGVTTFMIMLAAFSILLSRYSRQRDICIGSPIANRTHSLTESLIGFFVNTLVLRSQIEPEESFTELLRKTRQTCLDAYAHQDIPFEMLVEQLQPQRNMSHSPLFQVMFAFQTPLPDLELSGLQTELYDLDYPIAKFDLTLFAEEKEGQIHCNWEYATDLFVEETIVRMNDHFMTLLTDIVEQPDKAVAKLNMLTKQEYQQQQIWNQTAGAVPDCTLFNHFEEQAGVNPDNTAIIFADQIVTYRQLNQQSNQLAHHLLTCKPDREKNPFIAVSLPRSPEMIVSVLAVLKAGMAYLPIDPTYPAERIQQILAQSGAKYLITSRSTGEQLQLPQGCMTVYYEELLLAAYSGENLNSSIHPDETAYVIFTSGSTGQPKGVVVSHRSAINTIDDINERFSVTEHDSILALSSLSFDLSVYDIFGLLSVGGTVIVPQPEFAQEPAYWAKMMARHHVSLWNTVPALMQIYVDYITGQSDLIPDSLRLVMMSGDWIPTSLPDKIKKLFPQADVISLGGATEAAIWSIHYPITHVDPTWTSIPYGRPLRNQQIHVLNKFLEPCPVHVPGSLYIGGLGLAQCYWGDEEKTSASFIRHPRTGERLYRTGDLGRYLADGNVEFLGRDDFQVKINGFRIELGDIEAALRQHPRVEDALVTLQGHGNGKFLAAYCTSQAASCNIEELHDWLQERLPNYMLPKHIIAIEFFPLTANGKIDRKALPVPEASSAEGAKPLTQEEELLAAMWGKLLNAEQVSREDSFFERGGNSLLAMQLVARVRELFQVELPVRKVFEYPTLSGLVDAIADCRDTITLPPIAMQPDNAELMLSFAQRRLWFLSQLEGGISEQYNIPLALQLSGHLHTSALKQSLMLILERHSTLRTYFNVQNGQAKISIAPTAQMDFLQFHDLTGLPDDQKEEEVARRVNAHAIAPFDLTQDALFRAECLFFNEKEFVLLLNMHHIVSDGWSMVLFVKEWQAAYAAFVQEENPVLPRLEIAYSDYAAWQKNWLQGEILQKQVDYWKRQLAGIPDAIELPFDRPRTEERKYHGDVCQFQLSEKLSEKLAAFGQENNATLFMTLLAAFNILLARCSGQDDICVGTPIANRTQKQTENLIGFFVNTLVLRTNFATLEKRESKLSFLDLLRATRQTCLDAYTHQDIPFDILVEELHPVRSMRHSPLFQVMFALENNEVSTLSLPDLEVSVMDVEYPVAKFDLTLTAVTKDKQLSCWWEYATDIFDKATIISLAEHFDVLLQGIVDNPQADIRTLPLLTAEEARCIQQWNDTASTYSRKQALADFFEAKVAETPHAVAVITEEQQLTYQQLNDRANALAHSLIQDHGLQANTLVGLCVERSPAMLIALLAVLKTGAAYLPLHTDYPAERLCFMLEDSSTKIVLTQEQLKEKFSALEQLVIIDVDKTAAQAAALGNPQRRSKPEDLAYVIYTSGSTGLPKGVCVEHGPIALHCRYMRDYYRIDSDDRVLQFLPLSFDPSIEQIFCTWLGGAALIMLREELINPLDLIEYLHETKATVVDIPAPYWQQMCEVENVTRQLDRMRLLIFAGDVFPVALARKTQQLFPNVTCINEYGPTEAVIASSLYTLPNPLPETCSTVPIGRPTADTKLYILNADYQIQPFGIAGELCIAGASLARGYLNRPELTEQQFVTLELLGERQRVYKTGDLARWLPDGNIEYIGRVDNQIKLRGFRIELGEIEAVLRQHEAVSEAVVLLRREDEADSQLVAYLTVRCPVETQAMRSWLQQHLPDYMIPAAFCVVETMPIAPSGKIDRNMLALLEVSSYLQEEKKFARDATELQLISIWEAVLNQSRISIHDNFFELGGHSLLALQLMAKIHQQFDLKLPVSSLFKSPTVAELAEQLRERRTDDSSCLIPLRSGKAGKGVMLLLPEATGSVMYFYSLASSLGGMYPVYALQSPGLDGSFAAIQDLKELALFHRQNLRQQHITGPHFLVGHSAGGRVAYELAWLLEQEGEQVQGLAILDTYAPNSPPEHDEMDFYNEYNWLHDIVYAFETTQQTDLNVSVQDLEAFGNLEAAYEHVMELFRQHNIFAPNTSLDELKAMVNVYKRTCQADQVYVMPGNLHCPIHLFCASESTDGFGGLANREFVTQGWPECTTAEVREHWVGGNHMSMMFSPHVENWTAILSEYFTPDQGENNDQ